MKKRILTMLIVFCMCLDLAAAAGASEANAQTTEETNSGNASDTKLSGHPYAYLGMQDMPICNYLDAVSAFHYYMVVDTYADGYVKEEILVADGINSYREDENTRTWSVDGYYYSIDESTDSITEMEIDPDVLERSEKYLEEIKEKGVPELSSKTFMGTGKDKIPLYSYTGDTNEYEYYEYFTDFSSSTLTERYFMKDGDVFAVWDKSESDRFVTEGTRVIKYVTGEIPEGIFDIPGHEKAASSDTGSKGSGNTGAEKGQAEEESQEQADIWEIDREVLKDNGYSVDLIRDSAMLYLYEGVIGAESDSLVRMISASNSDKGSVIIIYYFETEEQAAACLENLLADAPYAFRREGIRIVKDDNEGLIH